MDFETNLTQITIETGEYFRILVGVDPTQGYEGNTKSLIRVFISGGSRGGGAQGAMPPKRWSNFFSHLVIQITDRFFE